MIREAPVGRPRAQGVIRESEWVPLASIKWRSIALSRFQRGESYNGRGAIPKTLRSATVAQTDSLPVPVGRPGDASNKRLTFIGHALHFFLNTMIAEVTVPVSVDPEPMRRGFSTSQLDFRASGRSSGTVELECQFGVS